MLWHIWYKQEWQSINNNHNHFIIEQQQWPSTTSKRYWSSPNKSTKTISIQIVFQITKSITFTFSKHQWLAKPITITKTTQSIGESTKWSTSQKVSISPIHPCTAIHTQHTLRINGGPRPYHSRRPRRNQRELPYPSRSRSTSRSVSRSKSRSHSPSYSNESDDDRRGNRRHRKSRNNTSGMLMRCLLLNPIQSIAYSHD